MKIYTKTGDKGETSLYGGHRLSKSSCEIEALGNLDELNAFIGTVVFNISDLKTMVLLKDIQNELFNIGAELAMLKNTNKKAQKFELSKSKVTRIEKIIDKYTKDLPVLDSFILPGGSKGSSYLHYARALARRAERSVVEMSKEEKINPNILSYLNRISDLFFTLARYANKLENIPDVKWQK